VSDALPHLERLLSPQGSDGVNPLGTEGDLSEHNNTQLKSNPWLQLAALDLGPDAHASRARELRETVADLLAQLIALDWALVCRLQVRLILALICV
jgi:hypothetical protein